MPLFEYACQACTHEFEALVRGAQEPECPACHSTALNKRQSVFAAHSGGTSRTADAYAAPAGCGHCGDPRGPGACSMN